MIRSFRHHKIKAQRGQIVVEYVLLLTIAVGLALIITSTMVSRSEDPDSQGFLIKKWRAIIETIASDRPDDLADP